MSNHVILTLNEVKRKNLSDATFRSFGRYRSLRMTFLLLCSLFISTSAAWAGLFSVSDDEVIQAGRRAHEQVMQQYKAWNNPSQQARIERLARRFTPFSSRPEIHYRFYLLDSEILNAFATPDGSIHVTRGLAAGFKNDNELSFILGHELTHVERRHGKQTIEKAIQTQLAGNLLLLALGQRNSSLAKFGLGGAQTWLSMKYSRDFETEADEGGMRFLKKAGIDPEYGPKSLQHLFELNQANPSLMTKYFGTHPMPEDRIQHAKTFAQELRSGVSLP